MVEEKGDIDWDLLLQATAAEAFEAVTDCSRLSLGDLAQGIARTSSLEKGLLRGDSSIPDQFKDVNLGEVLNSFAPGSSSPRKQDSVDQGGNRNKRPRRTASINNKYVQVPHELSVAEMVDSWVRDQSRATTAPMNSSLHTVTTPAIPAMPGVTGLSGMSGIPPMSAVTTGPPVIVSGVPLGALPGIAKSTVPELQGETRKKQRVGGRQATKKDEKSVKNRKSAAKSRKKRAEYTKELEERAKMLKDTNMQLRKKIVDTAKAPEADPVSLEGKRLRKTRTLPTNFKV